MNDEIDAEPDERLVTNLVNRAVDHEDERTIMSEAHWKERAERAELDRFNLGKRVDHLEREVEALRRYGNKDCTAMADEALAQQDDTEIDRTPQDVADETLDRVCDWARQGILATNSGDDAVNAMLRWLDKDRLTLASRQRAVGAMRSAVVKSSLIEAADMSIGCYPASLNGIPRTDWQNGWNAAMLAYADTQERFLSWFRHMEEGEKKRMIEEMLTADDEPLILDSDDDRNVMLLYDTSDLFAWGYSCWERIEDDTQLKQVYDAWKADPQWGIRIWECKRQMKRPQAPVERLMREVGSWDSEMDALPENEYDRMCRERNGKPRNR